MMRWNWFTITLLLISVIGFGQEKKLKRMPVIFGCEKYTSAEDVRKCFNETMGVAIANEIDFFSNIADYLHIPSENSKLKFTVTKDGKFENLDANGPNSIFNSFAMSSIILIQNKLNKLNLEIKPGIDQKDQPMDVSMTIPVRFKSQFDSAIYQNFPAENRVLFTIDFEDEKIEIRMNKDFVITTYGINGDREFYLGKYNNLFELATVEPYASKINDSYISSYTFITKGSLEDKEYTIRMKNFFSNNPEDTLLIEVFREKGDTWEEYFAYKTKAEFNQSKFAQLTFR